MAIDIDDTSTYDEAIKCRIEWKIESVKILDKLENCLYTFKVYLNNKNNLLYFDENKYSKPYYTDIKKTCNPNDIVKENYFWKEINIIVNAELKYQSLKIIDKNNNWTWINLCLMNRERLQEIYHNTYYNIWIILTLFTIIIILLLKVYRLRNNIN